jgi:hypothetical protein
MPQITGITLSVNFGDKEYGKGSDSFMNASLKWEDSEAPTLLQLDDVIIDGLDLYFAVWQTLLASRYTTGVINAEEFNKRLEASQKRLKMIRKFYKKEISEDH